MAAMHGRAQLEASTSGRTSSQYTVFRAGTRPVHRCAPWMAPSRATPVAPCQATARGKQQAGKKETRGAPGGASGKPSGGGDGDQWSSRLLELTHNTRKRAKRSAADDAGPPAAWGGPPKGAPPPPPARPAADGAAAWGARGGEQEEDDEDDFDWDDDTARVRGSGMVLGSREKRVPPEVRCFDTARIFVRSGDGGAGCVAFRREPFVEFGGPNGGNGGRGGHVWAVADEQLNSLMFFRKKMHWRAAPGTPGRGSMMDGADASDTEIRVPLGTIIRERGAAPGTPPLAELVEPGQRALLAVGGRGGRGNLSFKTSKASAPAFAEKGEEGREMVVDLELKVVADVGIVGVPNAGKSTLLSVVTAAKPKIANYPFTTLVPNLGVCEMDFRTTVFADVPGLLEGAHEGLGLGHEFLRHVQRCRALVHVVDGTSPDPIGDYKAIRLELELFNPELLDKPQVVAYNKMDVPDSGDYWEFVKEFLVQEEGLPPDRVFPVSAVTGAGVTDLVRSVRALLDTLGPVEARLETGALNLEQVPRGRAEVRIDDFAIEVVRQGGPAFYIVTGDAIERFAQMTNWDYYEAVVRFQRVLDVAGINAALRAKGIQEGDTVVLGAREFVWSDDHSETAMYGAWLEDMKNQGKGRPGSSHWPNKR